MYYPLKYHKGLSKKKTAERKRNIQRRLQYTHKNPRAYTPFATDEGVKTKTSSYTEQWRKRFPEAMSLEEKAKATGVPVRFLQASYDRGMAAWRTGHRPGATQQQWGYARVHSLLLCGKTYRTTDSDIVRRAVKANKKAAEWFQKECATRLEHESMIAL